MTTNELKCPVCGLKLEVEMESLYLIGEEQGKCNTKGCCINKIILSQIDSSNSLIQSRIDKAVQGERERIAGLIRKIKNKKVIEAAELEDSMPEKDYDIAINQISTELMTLEIVLNNIITAHQGEEG